ncbi:MAG: hypothetical protein LAT76_13220 [Schleiferiaceae bacterium]|nr:hypothetical protein [Schleiferiaceae bacterium]
MKQIRGAWLVAVFLVLSLTGCNREEVHRIKVNTLFLSQLPNFNNPRLFVSTEDDSTYIFQERRDTLVQTVPLQGSNVERELEEVVATYRDSLNLLHITYRVHQVATGSEFNDLATLFTATLFGSDETTQITYEWQRDTVNLQRSFFEGFYYPQLIWGSDTLADVVTSRNAQDAGSTIIITPSTGDIVGFRDAQNIIYNSR